MGQKFGGSQSVESCAAFSEEAQSVAAGVRDAAAPQGAREAHTPRHCRTSGGHIPADCAGACRISAAESGAFGKRLGVTVRRRQVQRASGTAASAAAAHPLDTDLCRRRRRPAERTAAEGAATGVRLRLTGRAASGQGRYER